MSGYFLYQWVLATAFEERMEAVKSLNDVSLCRLAACLQKDFVAGEPTGDVLGMCLVEGFKRFAKQWQGQVVPATIKEGDS